MDKLSELEAPVSSFFEIHVISTGIGYCNAVNL